MLFCGKMSTEPIMSGNFFFTGPTPYNKIKETMQMTIHLTKKSSFAIILTAVLGASSLLFADGFRNPPEGARAIGAFGAYRAFADDANAAVHNPANLVDLERPMIQINNTIGYARAEYRGVVGSDKTENPWFSLPGLSAAAPLADGRWALGFALNVPFGRSTDWGDSSPLATIVPGTPFSGEMMVVDANPNIAFRINDALSVAAGLNIYYSEVEQKSFLGLTTSKLTGDGDALGWNAAATWKITDRQRLAFTYRSPFTVDYDGEDEIAGIGTGPVTASIDFPYVAALAYGIEFTDTLRAEIDVERIGFGTYDQLVVNDPLLSAVTTIPGPFVTPQNWKDTWTYAIGGEWDFAANWTARTGFMYIQSPVPDETYAATGMDEDQGVISLGLGYETEHHVVDIGYAYGIFDGRNISGNQTPAYDGSYDYNVQLLAFSYGYKF